MQINKSHYSHGNEVTFDSLETGDLFWHEEEILMKTKGSSYDWANSVSVAEGLGFNFSEDYEVEPAI